MKEGLQIFKNEEFGEVRTVEIEGKHYFVGLDIARSLGYSNASKAVSTHCKNGIKEVIDVTSQNGNAHKARNTQEMTLITEGDVYRLIIKSKLPAAERFESWVMDEVLPSIRNNGGYIMNQNNMSELELLSQALLVSNRIAEENKKKVNQLELEKEINAPKLEFVDIVTNSDKCIDMKTFSKLLSDQGIVIGRNNLFKLLRENYYLMKDNTPYQRYINEGYFQLISVARGYEYFNQTLITGKGQVKLAKKIRELLKEDAA